MVNGPFYNSLHIQFYDKLLCVSFILFTVHRILNLLYTCYLLAHNQSLINAQHSNITHTFGRSVAIFLITFKYPCILLPR